MTSGCGSTMMSTTVLADAPLASVTEILTGNVPFVAKVNVSCENVYGPVPPDAEASQVIGLPAVPRGQEAVMTNGCGSTMMSTIVLADAPLASVTDIVTG